MATQSQLESDLHEGDENAILGLLRFCENFKHRQKRRRCRERRGIINIKCFETILIDNSSS